MGIYTCNEFKGRWPVGSAAVVSAPTQEEAACMLSHELGKIGLLQKIDPEDMILFDSDEVRILCDGDY